MSNSEYADAVMALASGGETFEPTATYDPDGDCIEFVASPEPFYAERVDDLVTVYYSQEKHEIVGSLIKGVSGFVRRLLEKSMGLKIDILDGRVALEHVFRARIEGEASEPVDEIRLTYAKLAEVAKDTGVEAAFSLREPEHA